MKTIDIRSLKSLIGLVTALMLVLLSSPSQAHFERFEPRVVFIGEVDDSLRAYVRMPLGLAILPTNWKGVEANQNLPFLVTKEAKDGLTYSLDQNALKSSPQTLIDKVSIGHQFWIDGKEVIQSKVSHARISTKKTLPQFSTLSSADTSIPQETLEIENGEIDLFDATLDVEIILPKTAIKSENIRITSHLGQDFETIDRLANVVTYYGPTKPKRQTTIGVMDISFGDRPKEAASVVNQLQHGATHILKGLDHVLIIVLIALTASTWVVVLRNATGFTIGHSITLSLGAYGYLPTAAWFAPMAEIFIAATILYGALLILKQKSESLDLRTICVIGLIHGIGFSFALEDVFQAAGDNAILTLLYFNLGVEIGQVAVYLALLPILLLLTRFAKSTEFIWKNVMAIGMITISAYWIFDRGGDFLETIF